MKIQKLVVTAALVTSVSLFAGAGDAQAKDVYKVDRYGELYRYSGNPVVTIQNNTSAISEDAFYRVRTSKFQVSSGNPYFKSVDGVLYSKDGSLLIKCPTRKTGSFTVPSSVKKIAEGAFENCNKLTRITIPDSVTYIGKECFVNASALTSVRLSSNINKLRDESFRGCKSLQSITIPSSVRTIENRVFERCQSLKRISLPDSVASIGYNTFSGCVSLTSARLSKKIYNIPSCTFRNCISLKTVNNAANVETIGSRAFDGCSDLRKFAFSNRLDEISWEAFRNCKSLGTVQISGKTTYIAKDAFTGAASRFVVDSSNPNYASEDGMLLNEKKKVLIQAPASRTGNLKIPKGVTRINSTALENGDYKSVTIPEGVSFIGKNHFRGCEKLESIELPASIKEINGTYYYDSDLRLNCLKKITIASGNAKYKHIDGVLYTKDGTEMVIFPSGRTGSLTLPDECKYITRQMKENKLSAIRVSAANKYFTSVDGVLYNLRGTEIECFPMKKVKYEIPKTLKELYYLNDVKAGLKCSAITVAKGNRKFYAKDGVVFKKYSHELLFYPTKKKGSYTVPKKTRFIASEAFEEAHNLTKLTITKNVRRRHGSTYRFYNCRKLKSVLVKEGKLNYIRMNFDGCNKLSKLTFPSNIMKTNLYDLPDGIVIYGFNNTTAKEAAKRANGTFVSRGTIPRGISGAKVKKIIDKYEIRWNANSEASGYQVYTTARTIQNLSGSGNTSCFVKDIYKYGTIYIRAYCIANGKKVYGKAKAVNMY